MSIDREAFVRAFLLADSLADFKHMVQATVFPGECQWCGKGLPPHPEQSMRDIYVDVVDVTERLWAADTATHFGIHVSTVPASLEPIAYRLLSLLETEISHIGFWGFIDAGIVTYDLLATLDILQKRPDYRGLRSELAHSTKHSPLQRVWVARRSQGKLPSSLQVRMDMLYSPVLLMHFPASRKEEPRSYVLVHTGMSELLDRELALQIKYRLRLELLQLIIRHLRSAPLKRVIRDLREHGENVPTRILESVQGIINEGIVHSWRYSLPERYGRIHTDINLRDYAIRLDYYWRCAKETHNVKAMSVAQNMLYTFIRNACIETLAAALGTSRGCELPQIAAGLVQGLPKHEKLFSDLVKYPPDSLYKYDPDDVAAFFKRVIVPHLDTFSLIQKSDGDLQNSLGVFSRYSDSYNTTGLLTTASSSQDTTG